MRISRKLMFLLSTSLCCGPAALAQNFPSKPIRIISGNPGGGSDLIARMSAQGLQVNLGQPAIVINRPGTQIPPSMEVAKSAPDGHTLLSLGANQFWLLPFLLTDVPYDPVRDFAPVSLTAMSSSMFVVHPSVPANNIKELVALAKSKPGVLNYGIGNYGGGPHLAGELFKSMTGTKIEIIPYKSTGAALNAVLAGQIELLIPTVSSGMPAVKAGKLRALGVTSGRPSTMAPGIPTIAETLPGYEASTAYAVFAPAKTPANVVGLLNKAIVKHLQSPDIKEKMFAAGLEIVASTPQELGEAMRKDREAMGKVIRDNGIKGEN